MKKAETVTCPECRWVHVAGTKTCPYCGAVIVKETKKDTK